MKYVSKAYWEEDGHYTWFEIQNNNPGKVHIEEKEAEWSGLLDQNGNPLFKVKDPIGFKCK